MKWKVNKSEISMQSKNILKNSISVKKQKILQNSILIKILSMLIIIFITLFTMQEKSKAVEIMSFFYDVNEDTKTITRIEPETDIETFKNRMTNDELETKYGAIFDEIEEFRNNIRIYREKECQNEVTEGYIGTGMYMQYNNEEDKTYELSVVGDFNGDGKATQVELTNIIKHIVGLKGATLEGIKYTSADLTGDETVDQRDITKFIRYIVYGELDLGKTDTTGPILELHATKQISDAMTVTVKALDKESGMGENPTFTFYIKKKDEGDNRYKKVQEGTSAILEITGLEQNTWYYVKVKTQDKAGNEAEETMVALTPKIPDGTEEEAIIFGETEWENNMASVGISTNVKRKDYGDEAEEKNETYRVEYQVNGTNGKWLKGNEVDKVTVTGLKHGDIVYARLTDGTNAGSFIYKNIIDDMEPSIRINVVTDDTKQEATATVILAEDDESGMDSKIIYTYYIKEKDADDNTYVQKYTGENNTYTFKNLKPNTKYVIKVAIQDKAGNIGTEEAVVEIKGEEVPDATEAGAIIFENLTWKQTTGIGQAEITIRTKTKYQIEYQINDTTGTWIKGPAGSDAGTSTVVTGLNHGDTIYARLTDGSKSGNYTSITIVDNIIPDLEITTKVKSTTEIEAEAIAKDNETGIDTSTATYDFYIKEEGEDDTKYKLVQNTTNPKCNITGLKAGKKYTIKVEIEDRAGNKATKIVTETMDKLPDGTDAGSILFSGITWNSGTAEVEISTNTEYQIEYQVNSTSGTWTKGPAGIAGGTKTTATGLKHGDIIYARLTDGTSSGGYATLTVVDTIKPNIELNLEAKNETITAEANAEDLESGLATDVKYKFYIKETGADDSTYVEKQNTTSNILTEAGLTIGKNYTIKVEVEDIAGNKGIIEKSILIPDGEAPIVDFSVIEKTSNSVKVQATATDKGGLPSPTIYIFYIKETGADDSTYREVQNGTNDICEITGLEQKKDYTIKVEVADAVGNVGIKERSILTDGIPDATEAGAINFESLIWKETTPGIGQAEVVISTKTKYQIEYQVNSTSGTWTKGPAGIAGGTRTTLTGLNHNDVIYARLTDGTSSSSYATLTVLDTKAPILGISTTGTTSGIKAIITAVDNETGMGAKPTYKFSIKANKASGTTGTPGTAGEITTTYIEKYNGTNATYNFTGLKAGETYTVKIETQDRAGNTAEKEQTITTKSIPVATSSITFGAVVWNKGQANVSISTTATSFYIEYQINSVSGTWTKAATAGATVKVEKLNHGDTIYARLTDGINAGTYVTLTIIDNIAPEDFTISVTNIKPDGFKVTGNTIDNQTGIKNYTYVIEKKGVVKGAVTSKTKENEDQQQETKISKQQQQSNNINRVSNNNNSSINTSRSNNININRRKRNNNKSKRSKSRTYKSTSKRKYRNSNIRNTNRRNTTRK